MYQPRLVVTPHNFRQIACGLDTAYALDDLGHVYAIRPTHLPDDPNAEVELPRMMKPPNDTYGSLFFFGELVYFFYVTHFCLFCIFSFGYDHDMIYIKKSDLDPIVHIDCGDSHLVCLSSAGKVRFM